jgi:hypothetical protein
VDIEPIAPADSPNLADSAVNPCHQSPRSTCIQLRANESGDHHDASFNTSITSRLHRAFISGQTGGRLPVDCISESVLRISGWRSHTSRSSKVSMVLNEMLVQWRLIVVHGLY